MNCIVCESEFVPNWTDQHGVAECAKCGATYTVVGFNGKTATEITFKDEFVAIVREYWNKTKRKTTFGLFISNAQRWKDHSVEMALFIDWLGVNYPEWL